MTYGVLLHSESILKTSETIEGRSKVRICTPEIFLIHANESRISFPKKKKENGPRITQPTHVPKTPAPRRDYPPTPRRPW